MIETDRLFLRRWRDSDHAPYHAVCRDPEVMRFLGPLQDRAESDLALDRMITSQTEQGFCFWAVEQREDAVLLGFCGLMPGKPPISGDVEIGWRFGSAFLGSRLCPGGSGGMHRLGMGPWPTKYRRDYCAVQ